MTNFKKAWEETTLEMISKRFGSSEGEGAFDLASVEEKEEVYPFDVVDQDAYVSFAKQK